MTKSIDFERAAALLTVVHQTLELPRLGFLKAAAIAELEAMDPAAVAKVRGDAEDPAPEKPVTDPSGKPLESTPSFNRNFK